MKRVMLAAGLAACLVGGAANAQDRATAAQAEAMVKKAVAFIKQNGPEKAYAEFSNKKGQFVDRDLYIVVHTLEGKCLAHGANEKLIGREMMDTQDTDGKYYMKERMTLAKSKQSFWQDYKFTNPVTKKIEPKSLYCERIENTAVCGGIYKS
jgi:signal transduction histidine kinase